MSEQPRNMLTGGALARELEGDTQSAVADTELIPETELPGDAMRDLDSEREKPKEE